MIESASANSNADRKAALLEARAKREAEADKLREAHEVLWLELEDKYSAELGPRGQAFEMVNESNVCGVGPLVFKKGDPLAHKVWQQKPGIGAPEDRFNYVVGGLVYPDRTKFGPIAHEYPELLLACVMATNRLFGFAEGELRKK